MKNQKSQLLENQVKMLRQHFDTVRIFATKYDNETGETWSFDEGAGSFPAQYGQIREWLLIQDEYAKGWARRHDSDDSSKGNE